MLLSPRPGPARARAAAVVLMFAAAVALLAGGCADNVENPAAAQGQSPGSAAPSTTSTSSVPPGGRQPSAADRLRVVLAGDSVMNGLAPAVATALNEGGEADASFSLFPSIARDAASRALWQRQLEETRPDLVVMLIGTWERAAPGFAPEDPAWPSTYQQQVLGPFADMVTGVGAKMLWIGMPAVPDASHTLEFAALNSQFEALADARDEVTYLDGGQYLNTPDGQWTDRLPRADGTLERVRRTDGLHLCPGGTERLAAPVVEWVQAQWNIQAGVDWQNGPWREPPTLDRPEECPPV